MQQHVAFITRPAIEPRMEWWTTISPRLGNEPLAFRFSANFFAWWRRQLVVIEDFPYVGVDFRGSANLVLPKGIHRDASGTKYHNLVTIFYLFFYIFLVVRRGIEVILLSSCKDRCVTFDRDSSIRMSQRCSGGGRAWCHCRRSSRGGEEHPWFDHGSFLHECYTLFSSSL
jgi:hypothetical protein